MKFTEKQQHAIKEAVNAVKSGRSVYKIGGYAGSGKTTIAKQIVEQLSRVAVCSFTGKAAYNLRQKGLNDAKTIHSTIYDYNKTTREFTLKNNIPYASFLIDEASMVASNIWYDILSFRKPIILIGDTAQLPPVGDDIYLMDDPDIILDTIHRQREEHGIVAFATNIREGKQAIVKYPNEVTFRKKSRLDSADLVNFDIILCGMNKTRHRLNQAIRYHKGYMGLLVEGEQLIILQNNPDFGVYNGEIVTVIEILKESPRQFVIRVESEGEEKNLVIHKHQLGKAPNKKLDRDLVFADYGYVITVHKSQGGEWEKVAVIDEPIYGCDSRRWRYTAVSRCKRELVYYLNG
jgi:exodeoxyribonuclease-5